VKKHFFGSLSIEKETNLKTLSLTTDLFRPRRWRLPFHAGEDGEGIHLPTGHLRDRRQPPPNHTNQKHFLRQSGPRRTRPKVPGGSRRRGQYRAHAQCCPPSIARMRSAAPPHFDDLFTLREARSLWPQKKNSKKRNFPRQLEIKHGSNSACFVSRTTSFSDPITRSRSASRTRVS